MLKDNKTNAIVERAVEGGINVIVDMLIFVSKIPLKIIWSSIRIPYRVIRRLARRLGKSLYRKTPEFIKQDINQIQEEYRRKKILNGVETRNVDKTKNSLFSNRNRRKIMEPKPYKNN